MNTDYTKFFTPATRHCNTRNSDTNNFDVVATHRQTRALERMGGETSHCPSETCDARNPPKILRRKCQTAVSLAAVWHPLQCLFMDEEVDELGDRLEDLGIEIECVYPSANRFPTTFENEIRNSIFVFCFPAISKNGIQTSIFVFRFP